MTMIRHILRPALVLLVLFTLLLGLAYPAAVTGAARLLFPFQATGSLVTAHGKAVGSALIGQAFFSPGYFWPRPSATAAYPYNALASGGSNLGPSSPALIAAVRSRIQALLLAEPQNTTRVPVDLVTASGSGLDPHISPASALFQVKRVARARHLPESLVRGLVMRRVQGRSLGFLGEPRVNVLALNLDVDAMARGK